MPASTFFVALESNCRRLEAKFIHDQLQTELHDIANFVADLEFLAAYRFLIHAEIEDYLERKARDELARLKKMVSKPPYPKISTMPWIYVFASLCGASLPFDYQYDEAAFFRRVNELLIKMEERVNENNGVKGETLKLISVVLGKGLDEIDQSLAANLTSFGQERGDIAHRSLGRVSTISAPSAEKQKVDNIMNMLRLYFNEVP